MRSSSFRSVGTTHGFSSSRRQRHLFGLPYPIRSIRPRNATVRRKQTRPKSVRAWPRRDSARPVGMPPSPQKCFPAYVTHSEPSTNVTPHYDTLSVATRNATARTVTFRACIEPDLEHSGEGTFPTLGLAPRNGITLSRHQVTVHPNLPFPSNISNAEARNALQ